MLKMSILNPVFLTLNFKLYNSVVSALDICGQTDRQADVKCFDYRCYIFNYYECTFKRFLELYLKKIENIFPDI